MADSPRQAEAAQALFCAMADYIGKNSIDKVFNLKSYKTYEDFTRGNFTVNNKKVNGNFLVQESLKQLDTPSVSLKDMERFLTSNNSWYESSVLTAHKIITSLSTIDKNFEKLSKPGWQNIFYIRGAKADKSRSANTMENVEALFKIANKNDKQFGDVNKWSPADIYFVSAKAATDVAFTLHGLTDKAKKGSATKESIFGFDELNELVNGLLDSGDLLPLSLKKVSGTATLHKYNFDRSKEEKYFANLKYHSISKRKSPYKADLKKYIASPVTRDIKIYFSPDLKQKIKIRHDIGHSKFGVNKALKVEIEVTGAGGRGGSFVGMDRLVNIVSDVDSKFGKDLLIAWTTGLKNYETKLNDLNTRYGVDKSDSHSKLAEQSILMTNPWKLKEKNNRPMKGLNMYEQYKVERIHLAGVEIDNLIYPVIENYFVGNETDKLIGFNSKIIAQFIKYASSRSAKSGMFVIAK